MLYLGFLRAYVHVVLSPKSFAGTVCLLSFGFRCLVSVAGTEY